VKNEEKLLARNLSYHQAAGVDAFYIFDDGSTDGTLASVRDLPGVHVSSSVDPADFLNHPQLGAIAGRAFELITGRQTLNTYVAFQQARLAGHEWMISLDADELLFLSDPLGIEGSLIRFFESVPPEVASIRFQPAELIPTRIHSDHPFLDNSHFRTASRRNARTVGDPYSGQKITLNSFIGHTAGKSAARTRLDIIHQTVHRFTSLDGDNLREQTARWLLHYNIHSFEHFIGKYRRFKGFPHTWLNGLPIEQPRALWIQLINDPAITEPQLLDYYRQNLLEDAGTLEGRPDICQFDEVTRFFLDQSALRD
jgi:hypothetical protein